MTARMDDEEFEDACDRNRETAHSHGLEREARRARDSEAVALDALVAANEGYDCCKDWHCEYCDSRKRVFQQVLARAGRR